MNRTTGIALLTLGALATCTGAFAQQLKANIPFEFTVGSTTMPAGEYSVSSPIHDVIELQSANRQSVAIVTGNQSYDELKSHAGGQLIFTKYGNQYFLDHVLCPTVSSLNMDIASGKAEKRARARALEAKNANDGQKTLVAMR
jgi:hypothetical protein